MLSEYPSWLQREVAPVKAVAKAPKATKKTDQDEAAPTASLGPHTITVTTPIGGGAGTFDVVDPPVLLPTNTFTSILSMRSHPGSSPPSIGNVPHP